MHDSHRPPHFYPGLAAFTDAIDALPHETIRHFTLLREVDAKACGPEELLRHHVSHALYLPPPDNPSGPDPGLEHLRICEEVRRLREEALLRGEVPPPEISDDGPSHEHSRRSRLHQVRVIISDLLLTLDEKIHVISTASEALNKHITRLDDAYQVVSQEIDAVVKDGNPHHWAYRLSLPASIGTLRQPTGYPVENAATETSASRTENGRETFRRRSAKLAIGVTDYRSLTYADSALSIPVPAAVSKASPHLPAPKRRKALPQQADQIVNNMPSEKNGATGKTDSIDSSAHIIHGNIGPVGSLKRNPGAVGSSANRNTGSRKRNAVPPPSTVLSPVLQLFQDCNLAGSMTGMQPQVTSVTETASKSSASRNPRSRPQTSSKADTSKPSSKMKTEPKIESKGLSGTRTVPTPVKVNALSHGKHSIDGDEKQGLSWKDSNRHSTIAITPAYPANISSHERAVPYDEETQAGAATHLPILKAYKPENADEEDFVRTNITTSNRSTQKLIPSFETSKPLEPLKRRIPASSKPSKNTGNEPLEAEDDDDDGDDPEDEHDEMRYCYCNQVSYGKMVACDGPDCQREWFHLPCVGLAHTPSSKEKWYCNDCKIAMLANTKQSKSSISN